MAYKGTPGLTGFHLIMAAANFAAVHPTSPYINFAAVRTLQPRWISCACVCGCAVLRKNVCWEVVRSLI